MQRTSLTESTDEQLARRAQQGCRESFELLMRRFQAPLLQFLRCRGAGSDAEDVLQETFLRAHANLHRYRQKWRFSTWLFTIARRLSINNHRKSRPVSDGEALAAAACPAKRPLELLVDQEDRRRLWDFASNHLCEDELTAMWLHYVEEMPTREIAAVLERSRTSIKTMMFRARRKLKPLLEQTAADAIPPAAALRQSEESGYPTGEVSHV